MKERLFLASPHMSDEGYEKKYIKEAFDTNWIAPLGANVNGFEKELAEYVGTVDAAALSAGTAAIHLALKCAGIGEGDIVFCQSLTFSATANPITYVGATPVFIDSDYETWNMSPVALEKAFDKYPNVKAVIVVNLYGIAANLDAIVKLCKEHKVTLIEDAAESLGTKYKDQFTGTFGDYGIFSFNGNKIITTSGGGMLVCNLPDEEKAKERIAKARFWATQARDAAPYYQHSEIGYNYRMSNIAAGIGRGQLKVLHKRVAKKQEIYKFYAEAFADIEDISMMPIKPEESSNCWLSCILLDENSKVKPTDILDALGAQNIESRHIWKPMHMQPVFADCDYIDNGGVGESIFKRGVCLPSDTKMTREQQQMVCDIVKGLWK